MKETGTRATPFTFARAARSLSLSGSPCSSIQVSAWVMHKHSFSALHSLYVISRERIAGIFLFPAFFSEKHCINYWWFTVTGDLFTIHWFRLTTYSVSTRFQILCVGNTLWAAYSGFVYNEHPFIMSRFLCIKLIDCKSTVTMSSHL